jgi:hypothetical protein
MLIFSRRFRCADFNLLGQVQLQNRAARRLLVGLVVVLMASGCASDQLNFNTLDIASSVSDVYLRQALDNFGHIIKNDDAVPSQVDILAGTVQTTNSITPNLTFPLSSMVASAVAATTTKTTTTAGASLGIMAADNWQQNWNITTVSDANQLRNLRALYRYEIVANTKIEEEYHVPYHYGTSGILERDPFFLTRPQCVICIARNSLQTIDFSAAPVIVPDGNGVRTPQELEADEEQKAKEEARKAKLTKLLDPNIEITLGKDFELNDDLKHDGWLYWKLGDGRFKSKKGEISLDESKMISLGIHDGYALYIQDKDRDNLARFLFFLLPVTEPTPAAGKVGGPTPPPGAGGSAANPRMLPFALPQLGIQVQ